MWLYLLCSRLLFDQILWTCSHQLAQKESAARCCQWINRSSNQCWVAGCWQGCGLNSQFEVMGLVILARVLWQYVSWGPHVCTKQNLMLLSLQRTQHRSDTPSALPWLLQPYQHYIEKVPEIPFMVEDKLEVYKKPKEAVLLLKKLKAWNGIKKSIPLSNWELAGAKWEAVTISRAGNLESL